VSVCGYLLVKKNLTWQNFSLVLVFFLLINVGQLAAEFKSGGANLGQLLKGAHSETNLGGSALLRNVSLVASCQVQANTTLVFSAIQLEKCGAVFAVAKNFKANKLVKGSATVNGSLFILEMVVVLAFSLGGYALAWYYYRRETDETKRNFLGLFLFYNLVAWLALLPVASQLAVRYFSILFFVPFVLLGLQLNFLFEKRKALARKIFLGLAVCLLLANVATLLVAAQPFVAQQASNVDNSILGEDRAMLAYLLANTEQRNLVQLDGSAMYLKRFLKPLNYLAQQVGAEVVRPASKQSFASGTQFFFIDSTKTKALANGEMLGGEVILAQQQFGKIIIYTLRKK